MEDDVVDDKDDDDTVDNRGGLVMVVGGMSVVEFNVDFSRRGATVVRVIARLIGSEVQEESMVELAMHRARRIATRAR